MTTRQVRAPTASPRVSREGQAPARPQVHPGLAGDRARFVIEGEPKPKQRPRFGRGRAYRSDRSDEQSIGWVVAAGMGDRRLQGSVGLLVTFYRSTLKRVDADNLLKLVMDACNGVAWADDSQVKDIRVRLELDRERPRTELEVWEIQA